MSRTMLPLTIVLAAVLAAPAGAQWQPDRFMISVWGCPDTPELAQAVADAGFNTVMCPAEHLDLCAEYGLQSIVRDARPRTPAACASTRRSGAGS